MIDRNIIELLACPASHRPLRPLSAEKLTALNRLVESGEARYVDGEPVEEPLSAGLVTDNETLIYRVDDDIPVLLAERGIPARILQDP